MAALDRKRALKFIEKNRIVLTFPEDNRAEPANLWSCFHPRKKMRWEWDTGGDDSVADLWIFREALSRSRKTVYAKWYRGKATFIDKDFLPHLLAALGIHHLEDEQYRGISRTAQEILEALLESSPLSTKQLKKLTGLQGRDFEAEYTKALKELWSRLWIVGWGEKDDGAFPSLNMGATRHFFEVEWAKALTLDPLQSRKRVLDELSEHKKMQRFLERLLIKIG
jgi:hypothetical protein